MVKEIPLPKEEFKDIIDPIVKHNQKLMEVQQKVAPKRIAITR